MSSKTGTGAKNSSASEPQTLSLRMSSSGGGGGSSGVATASANVADPSEIHLEEGIVQHQQLQDSDLSSTGHGGGVNKIHPASYRPASLTVNASSNSRNVSIIINPMEATTTSAPNGNSGNSNGGGGGSGGAPSGVTHMNGKIGRTFLIAFRRHNSLK